MKAIYDLQYREEMYERYLEKKDKLPQRFYKLLHAADSDNASSDGRFKIYIDFFEEFLAHLCQLYNSHYYAIDFPKNSSSALTELDNKLLRLSDSSRDSLSFGLYLNLCRAFNHAFSDWTPETLPGFRPEIFCIWHRTYTANVADQETDAYIVHLAHLEKYYKEAVKYKIPSDEIFRYVDDNLVSSKNRFNTDLDKVIGQVIRLRNAENHSREKPWWRKDEDSRKLVLRHL